MPDLSNVGNWEPTCASVNQVREIYAARGKKAPPIWRQNFHCCDNDIATRWRRDRRTNLPYKVLNVAACKRYHALTRMRSSGRVTRSMRGFGQGVSMFGYGQTNLIPATIGGAAQVACQAMQGSWDPVAMECKVGDQTYSLPDFQPSSLPAGTCPGGEVMTPNGCKPIPPGVEDECPAGQIMTAQGCVPVHTPPVLPPNGGQVTPPPAPAQTTTPSWVLPAAIAGIGAIAVIALVTTK